MGKRLKRIATYFAAKSAAAILPMLSKSPKLLAKAFDKIKDIGIEQMRKNSTIPEPVLERKIKITNIFFNALKNALPRLAPNVQRRLINNLWYNTVVKGEKVRQAYVAENGEWPPNFIAFSPSMKCNLRCVGCFASEYDRTDELTKDEVFGLIRQCNEDFGAYYFTVLGGEPTIWPHFVEMLETNPDSYFHVYTHGQSITEENAKRYAALGNVTFAISVEGDREANDWRRGKGSYDRLMKSMDYLREAGVLFGFSLTHTTQNHDQITSEEFLKTMYEKGAAFGWIFQYIPIGREPSMDLVPTPEQRVERFRRIDELRQKYPVAVFDFWNDGEVTYGCMAYGKRYLHVTNLGWVEPCVFVHFAKDNIRQRRLKDIILDEPFKFARSQMPFTEDLRAPCSFIDNTTFLPKFVEKYGFHPTHTGAEGIIGVMHQPVAEYADKYREMLAADPTPSARVEGASE